MIRRIPLCSSPRCSFFFLPPHIHHSPSCWNCSRSCGFLRRRLFAAGSLFNLGGRLSSSGKSTTQRLVSWRVFPPVFVASALFSSADRLRRSHSVTSSITHAAGRVLARPARCFSSRHGLNPGKCTSRSCGSTLPAKSRLHALVSCVEHFPVSSQPISLCVRTQCM